VLVIRKDLKTGWLLPGKQWSGQTAPCQDARGRIPVVKGKDHTLHPDLVTPYEGRIAAIQRRLLGDAVQAERLKDRGIFKFGRLIL